MPVAISSYLAGKHQNQFTAGTINQLTKQFGVPDEDVDTPYIITVDGPSNAGKSVFVAMAGVVYPNIAVASMSGFSSPNSLATYTKLIKETCDESGEIDIEQATKAINSYWQDSPESPIPQDWNLTQALDQLCRLFEGGSRPPLVLVDMPGLKFNPDGKPARSLGPFEAFSEFATEHLRLTRHWQTAGEPIANGPNLDWQVINNYLEQFHQEFPLLQDLNWLRTQMFVNWFEKNIKSFCQYYQEWQSAHLATQPNPSNT